MPSISLPKGGGAIRGIGEKLTVGLATGSASLSVPVFTSPGRSGFGPTLSLTYDSGGGNGPFGLGWRLTIPSVTRKTSMGLPTYQDSLDSDIFVLSSTEDLIPLLEQADGGWTPVTGPDPSGKFTVRRYRPRAEADFARIERWTDNATGDAHWRTISRDNVTSLFGQTPASRISDPADPARVFSWLLDCSYDARGNVVAYDYRGEDSAGVSRTVSEAGRVVGANRYLKRIRYGNTTPYLPAGNPELPAAWHFEVVLDYGDLDTANPKPDVPGTWPCRPDPFSAYRAGFEVRTYRLCRRVLMFHLFPDQLGPDPVLVRSTDLTYATDKPGDPALPAYSLLTSVTQAGYLPASGGGYELDRMPPVEFGYSQVSVHDDIQIADPQTLDNLPAGVDGQRWRWSDLDGEGLQGVLTEDDGAWYYKRNISAWAPDGTPPGARFEPLETVATKPVLSRAGTTQLADLHGDGRLCAVVFAPPVAGYFERDGADGWLPFTAFRSTADIDWADPNARTVDLDGDGLADLLVTDQPCFTWYPWLAEDGFGPGRRTAAGYAEDAGPAVVFANGEASVYLADMSGDGLADLVRVRNGETCYWPNLGYGRFGPKITMGGSPCFESQDLFDERRVRLTDLDGSGTADLVYLGPEQVTIWFNQSGNSWTTGTVLTSAPAGDDLTTVTPVDLLGGGTTCLVWSSPLPADSGRQLRYIDLMGGVKPHLLTRIVNNMGAETALEYAPSTRFYVQDRYAGRPWATRLPFPVHVVAGVRIVDRISRTSLVTAYTYHHGYFDGTEREFRGFGLVEQTDAESVPAPSGTGTFTGTPPVAGGDFALPPVRTRTWFHTGAYIGGADIAAVLAQEYYQGDPGAAHLDGTLFTGFANPASADPATAEETREALRALRGRVLRTEVYADDGSPLAAIPYACTEHRYRVGLLQPPGATSYGSFFASGLESLSYHYERDASDPRCSHDLTLEVDDYGTVTKSASVGYPRRSPAFPQQAATLVTYSEHDVINVTCQPGWYLAGIPAETRQFELTGATATGPGGLFTADGLLTQAAGAAGIPYEQTPPPGLLKRLFARQRTYYRPDDLGPALPLRQVEPLALADRAYTMAMTPGLAASVYTARANPATLAALALTDTSQGGGYVDLDGDGCWWAPSARLFYSADPAHPDPGYAQQHFYLPQGQVDPFGGQASVGWENDLVVVTATDPVHNSTTAKVNYRVLQPWLATDPNQNRAGARYDQLGMVTATALLGKDLGGADEGDHLDLTTAEASPADDPTTTFDYDLSAYQAWAAGPAPDPDHPAPVWAHTRTRVRHKDPATPWLETYAYTDGLGRAVLVKVQAEPGEAPVRDAGGDLVRAADGSLVFAPTQHRWVGSGRVVYDNKANPVKAYEPFFDSSPVYDDESDLVEWGVTAITRYDPLSRAIRIDKPDGSYTSTEFGPWRTLGYDENDNVLTSAWYAARRGGGLGGDQLDAAAKAKADANTPAVSDFDTRGRVFRTVADNAGAGTYQTLLELDISGRVVVTTDALGRVAMSTTYSLPGSIIRTDGADSGRRWLLPAADGSPLQSWDDRAHVIRNEYDAARRPTGVFVSTGGGPELLAERLVYGEGQPNDVVSNLRTAVYQAYSGAGVSTTVTRDFKGNVTQASQQLLAGVQADAGWSAAPPPTLDPQTLLTSSTSYDALNRITGMTTPDGSVTTPAWGERSLLAQVSLTLPGAAPTGYVTAVSYDPKGQRQSVSYGNGAVTSYTYDPETFRLTGLVTTRPSGAGAGPLQQWSYSYDPVGNITRIADAAQSTVFFANQLVAPVADYTYDAIYRLTVARGREHLGQAPDAPTGSDDTPFRSPVLPSDAAAMRNYTEYYTYDPVGNISSVRHVAAGGGWTRTYTYDEPNPVPANNRLTSTHVGSLTEPYGYDPHGNMTAMFGLPVLAWDFKDQLQATSKSSGSGPQPATWYRYDPSGKRVRKISFSAAGIPQSERIYFGNYEIYRSYDNAGNLALERQTVIVPDGAKHLALVETSYDKTNPAARPVTAIRYQFSNHLGSACLELNEHAAVLTYEEYFPYGATSFIAGRSAAEVSLKRYRYTGKEHDTENGLDYYGARYYAAWLGRWTASDPAGLVDGPNTYGYVKNNPVKAIDRTGFQHDSAEEDRYGRDKDPFLGGLRRFFGFTKADKIESFNGDNPEVLYQAREVRAKALQASGDAAVATAETVLVAQPAPEAEADALSTGLIEKVTEKASSGWSELGHGLKSLVKVGEEEASTVAGESESLFRRMSFSEAKSTLPGGLQASTSDTRSWVSTDAYYSHMFPRKQGSGQYDVVVEFKTEPGTSDWLRSLKGVSKSERGAENFGVSRAQLGEFNEKVKSINIYSTQPSQTRITTPSGDTLLTKTKGYSRIAASNKRYQDAVRSLRLNKAGKTVEKHPIINKPEWRK
ncbi:MAG TPA: SpvB/TcaC N-terminal domain-containing protein [Streptosporangiaceae bacterium]|nr:SpvB/TcaC N-terminal domain-containing protein [Streptosporangiaceae bacterium]